MFNVTCSTLRWVHILVSYYKISFNGCMLYTTIYIILCQLSFFDFLMSFLQEMVSVAVQNVQDMENIVKDPKKNGKNGSSHNNGNDPYKHFVWFLL